MSPEPSIEEFAEVFLHSRAMKGPRAKILRAHFDSPDYIATMSQLAQKVGYQNFNAANLQYGKLAKHLSKEIHWNEKETSKEYMSWISLLVKFKKPSGGDWELILKPNVVEALKKIGWKQGLLPVFSSRSEAENNILEEQESYYEGSRKLIYSTRYERDPNLRKQVIKLEGTACSCCGFDFEQTYGELGKGFIHIHHTKPLSTYEGEEAIISPDDLVPVCANCHMIIHRQKTSTLSIEDLKKIYEFHKGK